MVVPLSVVQINILFDQMIAWTFIGSEPFRLLGLTVPRFLPEGSVVMLTFAAHLYEMPLGVFSVALVTAIFPALARHGSENDLPGLRDTLRRGVEIALLIAIPATVGLVMLRTELVEAILKYGQFAGKDRNTEIVATTLACFALGLAAFSTQQLFTRAFYSVKQVPHAGEDLDGHGRAEPAA